MMADKALGRTAGAVRSENLVAGEFRDHGAQRGWETGALVQEIAGVTTYTLAHVDRGWRRAARWQRHR